MSAAHHETQFQRNINDGTWRGICTCGWTHFGTQAEVQGMAACHDLTSEPPEPVTPPFWTEAQP